MASWKDKLQPASFRGVPFEVESGDLTAGRRTQTHEYPGRDKPYTEDLGRATRKASIEAFLIGDDFMAKRDALLAALEAGGSGELVHPWHGRMTVNVDGDCRVRHGSREGRFCAVSISFVEAGELAFPAASASTGAQSLLAADALKGAAIADFSANFSIDKLPEFGVTDALNFAQDSLGKLDAALLPLGKVMAWPSNTLGDIGSLLRLPDVFAQRIFGLFAPMASLQNLLGDRRSTQRIQSTVSTASRFPPVVRGSAVTTPTRTRMLDNQDALAALMRRAVLVQSVGMSASVPVQVYDDGAALRTSLSGALEVESHTANDAVYPALQQARIKSSADLASQLRGAARLQQVTPREVIPAVVLAYDLYENPLRGDEIVARNKLRHPGFVPANPVRVLSS